MKAQQGEYSAFMDQKEFSMARTQSLRREEMRDESGHAERPGPKGPYKQC